MEADCSWLHQSAFFQGDMIRQAVKHVGIDNGVIREPAVRLQADESELIAEIVTAFLAVFAMSARDERLGGGGMDRMSNGRYSGYLNGLPTY